MVRVSEICLTGKRRILLIIIVICKARTPRDKIYAHYLYNLIVGESGGGKISEDELSQERDPHFLRNWKKAILFGLVIGLIGFIVGAIKFPYEIGGFTGIIGFAIGFIIGGISGNYLDFIYTTILIGAASGAIAGALLPLIYMITESGYILMSVFGAILGLIQGAMLGMLGGWIGYVIGWWSPPVRKWSLILGAVFM